MRHTRLPRRCAAILARHLRPELFKALCDPTRLMLVARLASTSDTMTVTDASDRCGVHVSGTSRHLSLLKSAGIVEAQRNGREVVYRLKYDTLIETLRGFADALEQCRDEVAGGAKSPEEGARR